MSFQLFEECKENLDADSELLRSLRNIPEIENVSEEDGLTFVKGYFNSFIEVLIRDLDPKDLASLDMSGHRFELRIRPVNGDEIVIDGDSDYRIDVASRGKLKKHTHKAVKSVTSKTLLSYYDAIGRPIDKQNATKFARRVGRVLEKLALDSRIDASRLGGANIEVHLV